MIDMAIQTSMQDEGGGQARPLYVLGINSAYHESSACLLRNGVPVAMAEEERFTRVKHAKPARVDNPHELPGRAIAYCLREAGITLADVHRLAYSFVPRRRLEHNLDADEAPTAGAWGTPEGETLFHDLLLSIPRRLGEWAGADVSDRFLWVDHHVAHAASAFHVSPFEQAAIASIDGIGESTSTFLAHGEGGSIGPIKQISYPHSIGFLWEKLSKHLGFSEYDACKVMGLAAYGDPRLFEDAFRAFVHETPDGGFVTDNRVLQYRSEDHGRLEEHLGPRRQRGEPIAQRHKDIAAALQLVTERIVLHLARHLREKTGSDNLCLAGGVGLNCVANAVLLEQSGFRNVFVQPAANDAGTAMGAATHVWQGVLERPKAWVMEHPYLGPQFTDKDAVAALEAHGLRYEMETDVCATTARLVADGAVVAWFQGRMEVGPRALGNRSIVADPRNPRMRDLLNVKVKHREEFRPFAPSVLDEEAAAWFEVPGTLPKSAEWMLFAFRARPDRKDQIPAVIHVDGTSRIQVVTERSNPRYHRLIRSFRDLTGVPMLLNTSFNDSEPIVCTPEDAVKAFLKTRIDALVMGDMVARKA